MPSPVTPKHRSFTADPDSFDVRSAAEFQLLTALGLREFHFLLDIGCGSLGAGRLLIPYLLAGRYFGIEREQWLVEEGVRLELGHDQVTLKQPRFLIQADYRPSEFGVKFDYAIARSVSSLSVLEESAKCLRKSGVLVTSSKNPEGLCNTAAQAGLHCKVIDWHHLAGDTWMVLYPSSGIAPEDPWPGFQGCTVVDLSELEVVHNADCGFIESPSDEGGSVVFPGWGIHPETRRPVTHALAADGAGRVVAKTRVGLSRGDIASAYGKQALRSGFRLRMETEAVKDLSSLTYLGWTVGEKKAFVLRMKS